jgi:hypothetical protein
VRQFYTVSRTNKKYSAADALERATNKSPVGRGTEPGPRTNLDLEIPRCVSQMDRLIYH